MLIDAQSGRTDVLLFISPLGKVTSMTSGPSSIRSGHMVMGNKQTGMGPRMNLAWTMWYWRKWGRHSDSVLDRCGGSNHSTRGGQRLISDIGPQFPPAYARPATLHAYRNSPASHFLSCCRNIGITDTIYVPFCVGFKDFSSSPSTCMVD